MIELLVNLIEGILFYYVLSQRLTWKYQDPRKYLCLIGDFLTITLCNYLELNSILSCIIILAAELSMAFLLTKNSVSEIVFWGSICSILSMISENFVLLICEWLLGNKFDLILESSSFRYNVISIYVLLQAALVFIIVHIRKPLMFFPAPAILMMLFLVLTGIVSMSALNVDISKLDTAIGSGQEDVITSLYFVWFSFWTIWILLFALLSFMGILYKRNLTLREAYEEQRLERAQYELLDSSSKLLQAWKHDNRNHLQTILQLNESKKYDECRQYITQLIDGIHQDSLEINTGNPVIDAILSLKKIEAEKAGIAFSYELYIPPADRFPISNLQLSSLLGNLMSNAIEAGSAISDAYISLRIQLLRSNLLIEIKNSSTGAYNYDTDRQLRSTKKDAGHGIGLKKVKKIVEEAGGFCRIQPESDNFLVSILLPLNNPEETQ